MQKDINALLVQRQTLIKANTDLMSQQVAMSKQICAAMEGKAIQKAAKNTKSLSGAAQEASKNVKNMGGSIKDVEKNAKEAAEKLEAMHKKAILVGGAVGAIKGLKMGFGMLTNIVGGAFRAVTSLVGGLFNIGKAIISIPFKIFGGLVDMAQGMGSPVFLQALEEVRKSFGDIATGSGKALRDSVRGIKGEFNGLTQSAQKGGPSFARVFGYGREGMAAALKFNAEMATELGGSFAGMKDKIKGNFAELAIYRKGLGLTAKQQAMFMKQTDKAGGDFMARFKSISSMSIQVGKHFGYSAKEIGQTVGKMFENVKIFGGFTDKALVSMAVQSKRLGVELDALVGVAEGFDDYEQAAQSVGNLHRAFGMQLDSMKMFQEQDPTARIQMMQKAFKEAGQSVEGMTRSRVSFLAQNAKISEEDARLIFSKKGLEMDYNEVQKKTSKAKSKEMKMASVMLNLSKQIERVFGSGGKKYKGFFDAFSGGFTQGVMRTREFRTVLRNINKSLKITKRAGRAVGVAFVKHFPGVKDFLGALADFFNPRKFAPMAREMTKEIEKFFKALEPGKEREAFDQFGKGAMGILRKYFGGKGEAMELMVTAFDKIATIFGNLKLIFAQRALDGASDALNKLTTFLTAGVGPDGKYSFGNVGDAAADAFGNRFGDNAQRLFNTFAYKFIPAVQKAAPILGKVAMAVFDSIRQYLAKHSDLLVEGLAKTMKLLFQLKMGAIWWLIKEEPMIAMGMAAILFGPSLAGAAIGALTPILMKQVLPRVAASLAASGVGTNLMTSIFAGKGSIGGEVASQVFDTALSKKNITSAAGNLSKKSGFLGRIGGGIARLFGAGAATAGTGAAGAAGAGLVAGGLGGMMKLATKAMPWAAVAYGLYEGVQHGWKKFEKTGKSEDLMMGIGGGFISSLTLGIVSPESGEKVLGAAGFMAKGLFRGLDRGLETGSVGKGLAAMGAGMVEGITFGFLDGDKLEDGLVRMFGGESDRYVQKLSRKFEKASKKHAKEFKKAHKPIFDAVKEELQKEIDELNGVQKDLGSAIFYAKKAGDSAGVKTLEDLDASFKDVTTKFEAGKKAADKALADLSKQNGDISAAAEKVAKELENDKRWHDAYDDNVDIPSAKMSKAMKAALRRRGLIKSDVDGVITLDGDRKEEVLKVLKNLKSSDEDMARAASKVANKEMAKGEKALLAVSKEKMLAAAKTMEQHGQDTSRIQKMMEKQAELESKKAAILAIKGWSQADLDVHGIDGALKMIQAAMKKGGNQAGLGALEAKIIDGTKTRMEGPLKELAKINEDAARDAKLDKLEAAKATMDRIEELKDIPERLKTLEATFKDVDETQLKELAKKVISSASKIAESMDAAMKGPEGKALRTKTSAVVSDSVMDLLEDTQKISTAIQTFMKAEIGDTQTTFDKAQDMRKAILNIKNAVIGAGTGISPAEAAKLGSGLRVMRQLADGSADIVESLVRHTPTDLATKVKATTKGLKTAKSMLKQMKKVVDIEGTMDLVKAINSGGELTVKNDNKKGDPINIAIQLNVSAKHLARSMVNVKGVNASDTKSQIMTTAYVLGKDKGKKKAAVTTGGVVTAT